MLIVPKALYLLYASKGVDAPKKEAPHVRHEASFSQNTDKQTEQTNPLLIRLPWQKQEDRKSMEPARGGRRNRRLNLSGRNEHNARSSKSSRDVAGPPFDFSGFAYIPPLTNAACCKKLDSFSFKHKQSMKMLLD